MAIDTYTFCHFFLSFGYSFWRGNSSACDKPVTTLRSSTAKTHQVSAAVVLSLLSSFVDIQTRLYSLAVDDCCSSSQHICELVFFSFEFVFNFCFVFFVDFAASVPVGGPEETAGPRHRPDHSSSQQLVSQERISYSLLLIVSFIQLPSTRHSLTQSG